MAAPTMHAAKSCYALLHAFFDAPSSKPLNSLILSPNDNIVKLDKFLKLPSLYPPSFDEKLHRDTQNRALQSYNNFLNVLSHWELNEMSISYNGGKDCLVQLIIYMAAIYQHVVIDGNGSQYAKEFKIRVNATYVHTETEFEEQIQFLEKSVLQYGLDFTAVYTLFNERNSDNSSQIMKETINNSRDGAALNSDSGSIKCLFSSTSSLQCGFATYLDSDPNIKAIIVGIRRTDPYGALLNLEQATDTNRGWPDFMRIHPILDWHTSEVWYFIKWLERSSFGTDFPITYCSLYDSGYTSLGGCDNTVRNPQLKRKDTQQEKFWPAWWVLEDDIERLSRVQKGKV